MSCSDDCQHLLIDLLEICFSQKAKVSKYSTTACLCNRFQKHTDFSVGSENTMRINI